MLAKAIMQGFNVTLGRVSNFLCTCITDHSGEMLILIARSCIAITGGLEVESRMGFLLQDVLLKNNTLISLKN